MRPFQQENERTGYKVMRSNHNITDKAKAYRPNLLSIPFAEKEKANEKEDSQKHHRAFDGDAVINLQLDCICAVNRNHAGQHLG
jgi:hypothetical protein